MEGFQVTFTGWSAVAVSAIVVIFIVDVVTDIVNLLRDRRK